MEGMEFQDQEQEQEEGVWDLTQRFDIEAQRITLVRLGPLAPLADGLF